MRIRNNRPYRTYYPYAGRQDHSHGIELAPKALSGELPLDRVRVGALQRDLRKRYVVLTLSEPERLALPGLVTPDLVAIITGGEPPVVEAPKSVPILPPEEAALAAELVPKPPPPPGRPEMDPAERTLRNRLDQIPVMADRHAFLMKAGEEIVTADGRAVVAKLMAELSEVLPAPKAPPIVYAEEAAALPAPAVLREPGPLVDEENDKALSTGVAPAETYTKGKWTRRATLVEELRRRRLGGFDPDGPMASLRQLLSANDLEQAKKAD